VYNAPTPKTLGDIWALPLTGDRKPVPVVHGPFSEDQAQISPNGRWIAYRSNESGKDEVYVRPFSPGSAAAGGKWQISEGGGWEPRWRRDSKELFYLTDTKLMAVDVRSDGATFEAGVPKPLFEVRLGTTTLRNRYVVSRDGRRFLMNLLAEETTTPPYTVVLNWAAGLKAR
jgi:hypothetical protein